MQITTDLIKSLRDETGVSVMQCKKALEEAAGDVEKARMILKKKSSEIAAKKSDREASQGTIIVLKNNEKAVIVELNCETDFVAKNADFITLANTLAEKALTDGIASLADTAEGVISPVIQKVGENIRLGRVEEISGGTLGSYVHDGKIAVVTKLEKGTPELAKDIAMHIAAMNPEYTTRADVPDETLARAKELFEKEVAESDKPEEIKAKMLQGKIDTYFKEQTLMDQLFFKDQNTTIAKVLENGGATLVSFVRVALG